MSEEGTFGVWIDPDGQVWFEDPSPDLLGLARGLNPFFGWAAPTDDALSCFLRRTRTWPVPEPWPEELAALWQLHEAAMVAYREPGPPPPLSAPGDLLTLKRVIARRLLRSCVLCEHRCGVDREAEQRGRCRVGARSYFASAYVHAAEEREVAPTLCVPLTGCSWHCVYCHTPGLINRPEAGTELAANTHAGLTAKALAPEVRSVSFVGGNPDHHLPAILDWLAATPATFDRAVVWNSNMYGSPELYRLLEGVVDVHIGDLRYGNDRCAARLSGVDRCWEPVARNWQLASQSEARLIARVLLLPGHHSCCTGPILRHLAEALPGVSVSLLPQYHPAYRAAREAPELAGPPSAEEIAGAFELAAALGLRLVAPVEADQGPTPVNR